MGLTGVLGCLPCFGAGVGVEVGVGDELGVGVGVGVGVATNTWLSDSSGLFMSNPEKALA